MNILALLLAAVAVAAVPSLWYEVQKRLSLLPERAWSFTASLLIVLPGTTGVILILIPFAPVIEWGRPEILDTVLILATSPILWGIAILVGIFSQLIGFAIQSADINAFEKSETTDEGTESGPTPWLMIPLMSLVGGAEELLFRGIVLIWLVDGLGIVVGILLNGVLFGLYHYPNSVDSVRKIDGEAVKEMSLSGTGGLVFAALYIYTGNLLVPLFGHALHNAGLGYFLYAQSNS
jgi:membrane protease YdiL (CAAX protease family)